MSPLLASYKQLLAQTQHYLTERAAEGQDWVYADLSRFPKTLPLQRPVAAPPPPRPVAALPPPPPQRVPVTAVPPPTPPPAPRPTVVAPLCPPPPVAAPAPRPQTAAKGPAEPPADPKEAQAPHQPFVLTPMMPMLLPDLKDVKTLIANVAPALRLIEAVPVSVVKSVQRIPEGSIALILTPQQMNPQANTFLEAVANAIELRFGPCGILDSHALVSAKQKFPAPGPRLIPIADPTIYLREPMRKAELWNEIRRKLGKPTLPPR